MLTMKWIFDIDGRLKAVWSENVENRCAGDFPAGAPSARALRAGGPPGYVRRSLAARLKDQCRTQSPLCVGVQPDRENHGVTTLASRWVSRRLGPAVILACLFWNSQMKALLRRLMWAALMALALGALSLYGQDNSQSAPDEGKSWDFHVQATAIPQGHGGFDSPYSGQNSLSPAGDLETSLTTTFFIGRKLWNGAEIYLNPEILAGKGIGSTLGIAGFPNGEIYRVDSARPKITLARFFIRQTWNLGGTEKYLEDDQNQLPSRQRSTCITVTMGKFSVVDLFDGNTYSHDARTQFLNWSLMDNGAWDFAADTRGYTYGLAVEMMKGRWTLRYADVMMPKIANGMGMDTNIARAHADNLELERRHTLNGHTGAVRVMSYNNHAHMGNYRTVLNTPADGLDITKSRTYSRKYGFGINGEQEIFKGVGAFLRAGWNDGHTETFAFTEIDRTASGGVSVKGLHWKRKSDTLGVALVANGISRDHREYLATGGYGFIIGDGKLNYGKEVILESYYSVTLRWGLSISPNFQYVTDPAYNRDRGPVPIYAMRFHWEK
jgi:high affinity Mn2+ porin